MKFTLNWLKDHLDTDASLDTITETLTAVGLEVESVEDPAAVLADFSVAYVRRAEPHPDADRLKVCEVETRHGVFQVVCGAPNARAGMKGVFAPPGSFVPGINLLLKKVKIRGVESEGMLCSEREMMISDEHEGIIELPDDAPLGGAFAEVAGLDDPVVDVAITPNRQDCLGVSGIARDLAAAGVGRLIDREIEPIAGRGPCPVGLELKFDAPTADACPVFVGRLIRGVDNRPSPAWLQQRLRAIGLRPISALVDITNLITFDRSRPLHVYDADKLSGTVHARLARKGETVETLDGKTYQLTGSECVIADDSGAIGLGGVIGGVSTGVTEETTDVFVECAYFDPVRTAMTGRRHGIESDARYRFERGIDPDFVVPGMHLATAMILKLCGGEASEIVIAGAIPETGRKLAFRPSRVGKLGGLDVDAGRCTEILERLGFEVADNDGSLVCTVPGWRSDIDGEADLVEEVLRIVGYDRIEAIALPRGNEVAEPTLTVAQQRDRAVRRRLAAEGLVETVTWSFMDSRFADLFGGGEDILKLANPISSELDCMRPSLMPNLILAAGRNLDRGTGDVRLFEVGASYKNDRPEGQKTIAAGVRAGQPPRHWQRSAKAPDVFDAKADALAALDATGAPVDSLQVLDGAPDWYHPGRSGTLRLGPNNTLAAFGELHPGILARLDVTGPIAGFEIFLDAIPAPKPRRTKTKPALESSNLPAVSRDFAFVVDDEIAAGDMIRAAAGAAKPFAVDLRIFDVYSGKGLEDGKKSIAIEVRLQPREQTFTDGELDRISEQIATAVEKATGGKLRSGR